MPGVHDEATFEAAIESYLLGHGYLEADPAAHDAATGLYGDQLWAFLEATQPGVLERLGKFHGADLRAKVLSRVAKQLTELGALRVLRQGIKDSGETLRLAYFKPAAGFGPVLVEKYEANRVAVMRQVPLVGRGSVDLGVFVNGIPVATAELKNKQTGQDVSDAIAQYRDRNPKEPLFAYPSGALVHFAVDQDEVHMTTRLNGPQTRFLPFNRGRDGGAGNPDNPDGYRTAYWFEDVLARDSLLDLLQRFVTIEYPPGAKDLSRGRVIFPRFHQWDAVRRLESDAKASGSGHNYLIQHSTGSGKSLSIAWTAHRLFSLHTDDDERVFHSVIVVSDRRVIDSMLQDAIYGIEHKHGVVEKIEGPGAKSERLAEVLESGAPIIITTLQTFPFVIDRIGETPARNYAVIVDEAHSSQTGISARKLREVLAVRTLDEAEEADEGAAPDDVESEVLAKLETVGRQPNLSFFAFTATPKAKTLEMFGTPDGDGMKPFHSYTMKQAIEEGFIVDVLGNYTTYERFFKLAKSIEGDPAFESRAAQRAIMQAVDLDSHNIGAKVETIVTHFRTAVAAKIGGKAKAMVVTRSRLHAVRYYLGVNQYLADHGGDDIGVLVAFSGTVKDPESGKEYTEASCNGFGEGELPEQFDLQHYRMLIVAEKYQTGFSQSKLHTMYVDKKLEGLHAVQTLGRLNRIHPQKDDTFVLDFVNTPERILEGFSPYYEVAELESRTDPNVLYTLQTALDDFGIYYREEVEAFAEVFFKPAGQQDEADQGKLNGIVDPAITRFQEADEEAQDTFRRTLGKFIRLYAFLAYVVTFKDPDLEKLLQYGRWLQRKLPADAGAPPPSVEDKIVLAAYRLDQTGTHHIVPGEGVLKPEGGDIGIPPEELHLHLSELLAAINERFGLGLTEADQLYIEQVGRDMLGDKTLAEQAKNNPKENFRIVFDEAFLTKLLGRQERNDEVTKIILDKPGVAKSIKQQLLDWIYDELRARKTVVELIDQGESAEVEFKSSARWNHHAEKETPEISDVITKTVAAFLNTGGGTLLVGVDDDGQAIGLDPDLALIKGNDLDGYENWLVGAHLQDRLGKVPVSHVSCSFEKIDDQDVCRLDVGASPGPVFAKTSKNPKAFYIRQGNSTHELDPEELLTYVEERWGG